MLFAVMCKDKAGSLDIRMASRPDHLSFLEGLGDQLKAAGPLTDDSGSPIGSLLIIDADNRKAIETLCGQDPYAKVGLFETAEIVAWKWLIKNPEEK